MPRARSVHIASWNCENLAPHLATPGSVADVARAFGEPDVLCLQEVRVRPRDASLVAAMEEALPRYEVTASLCDDPRNATFRGGRVYGVVTYTRKALAPIHVARFAWDREGRVAVTVLPERRLAIVNVYAVNGTDAAYFDHDLGRVAGDRHAWKRRFIERLAHECGRIVQTGHALVVIGDFNVSRTKLDTYPRLRTEEPHARARREFNDVFMPSLDLVDVWRELHPDAREYTWFNRRARGGRLDAARVDFALVSRALAPHVKRATIDPDPAHRFRSDHAPISLEIRIPGR